VFEGAAYKRVTAVKERDQHRRLLDRTVGVGCVESIFSERGGTELALGDKGLKRVSQQVGVCTSARPNAFFEFLQTDTSRCESACIEQKRGLQETHLLAPHLVDATSSNFVEEAVDRAATVSECDLLLALAGGVEVFA
jgi:hypothetical protein